MRHESKNNHCKQTLLHSNVRLHKEHDTRNTLYDRFTKIFNKFYQPVPNNFSSALTVKSLISSHDQLQHRSIGNT